MRLNESNLNQKTDKQNKMKRAQLTLAFLFCTIGIVTAQKVSFSTLGAADRAFEQFSYLEAADLYKAALEKGKDSLRIYHRLSDCFLNVNDNIEAENALKTLMTFEEVDPQYMYHYAQVLLSNEKLEMSRVWYEKYAETTEADNRVPEKLKAIQAKGRFFRDSSRFEIARLEANTPGLDFAPIYYKDGLAFLSSRPSGRKWVKTDYNWDDSEFLDLYVLSSDSETATKMTSGLNSEFHEGPAAFYDGETKVILTRNNFDEEKLGQDDKGVTRLKMYFGEWNAKQEKWKVNQAFEHNSNQYSVGHPTINEGGDLLVFTSDMDGSIGETDLFYSVKKNEKWSKPETLGDKVNSAGKEMFPFLIGDKLFFASDGRGGLGGLDIFIAQIDSKMRIGEVQNVGFPINSPRDDFGLITNEDFTEGYFTSARDDAFKDDIYSFSREVIEVRGQAVDAITKKTISGADVFLVSSDREAYYRSGMDGYWTFPESDEKWTVTAGVNNYSLVKPVNVDMSSFKESSVVKIFLTPLSGPVDEFPIPIFDFRIDKLGLADELDLLGGGPIFDSLKIGPIYYDLDKSDLRDHSIKELDRLASFIGKYPHLIIHAGSHTDARSSNSYNNKLSQRRSQAAYDYLIGRGVNPDNLFFEAKGEQNLINDCTDNKNCEEQLHQQNRRTEFLIIGTIEPYIQN